ncbi:MAG: hypothetical protein JSU66_15470 [Deltaproteobacteria bacterium]|nr:MAG: hypothetical protein JSU66_15470 [Deltaproteobacteria bacterium]
MRSDAISMRAVGFAGLALAVAACALPAPAPSPTPPSLEPDARESTLEGEIEAARIRDRKALEAEAAAKAAEPGPTTTESDTPRLGIAQVESVEIAPAAAAARTREVIVTGSHPDACTEVRDVALVRRGSTLRFAVSTFRPPGSCAAVSTPFREVLPLDASSLAPGTYTVVVNGRSAQFTRAEFDDAQNGRSPRAAPSGAAQRGAR